MSDDRPIPPEEDVVFCGLCRRPHVFVHQAGLQFRDCQCGGIVSLHVKRPHTRFTFLEVDL